MDKFEKARKLLHQRKALAAAARRFAEMLDEAQGAERSVIKHVRVGSYVRTLRRRIAGQAHAEEVMKRVMFTCLQDIDPDVFTNDVMDDLEYLEMMLDFCSATDQAYAEFMSTAPDQGVFLRTSGRKERSTMGFPGSTVTSNAPSDGDIVVASNPSDEGGEMHRVSMDHSVLRRSISKAKDLKLESMNAF